VLEDAWGRPIYLMVYLVAGVMSHQFYAWVDHRYIDYSLGASGAIAGLMGAFLVRFPKKEIRMTWFFFPFHRFGVPAYLMLPVWVLLEISDGTGPRDGITTGHTLGASWLVRWQLSGCAGLA
jgi:membrane associated rhomboid family serine protease